jgi:hypothetical protein
MAQLKFVRVLQVALLSLVVSLGFWGFSSSNSNLLVDVVQARAKFDATTVSENSMPFVIVDSEAGVSSVVDNINNEIRVQLVVRSDQVSDGWKFVYYNSGKKRVSIDRKNFLEYPMNTRQKIMDIALSNLKDDRSGGLSARDRARLYKFVEDQDTNISSVLQAVNSDVTADLNEAQNSLKFFTSPLGTLLGVLTILICATVGVSMAMDVFAMMTPSLMYHFMKKGDKRPVLISPEAWFSYKDGISKGAHSNYMITYLSRSIPKLVVTGTCLAYIMIGNTTALAIFFANLFNR